LKSETYQVLDRFYLEFIRDLNENGEYYSSIIEAAERGDVSAKYVLEKLRLKVLILKIAERNKSLAKYVYLKASSCLTDERINPADYLPKRGKKPNQYVAPVKYIMDRLKCSRRMALAYQQAMLTERKIDEILNMVAELLISREKTQPKRVDEEAP